MILVTSVIATFGMIFLPILLGIWLTRKFQLSWKLFLAGAATFIASQVLRTPLLSGLTAMFKNGMLPSPPEAWSTLFNTVVLGLSAGIFEETARYVLFKFILKKTSSWNEGVLVGAGHGGVEAIFTGLMAGITVINMVALRNMDLSALGLSAEQAALAKQQVDTFWASPAYMGLIGLFERAFAMSMHITLSVMVLYSVAYKKPAWFWLAILWHALADGLVVYLLPILGVLGVEGVIAAVALLSLAILFGLRLKFVVANPPDGMEEAQVR